MSQPLGVRRVVGPLVELEPAGDLAMAELVELGPLRLPGEVVGLDAGRATVQAYEYTGGLRPGDPARSLGRPLSARLGPGLLGGLFDGLLRPLSAAPSRLAAGGPREPETAQRWHFVPTEGLAGELHPGDLLGTVRTGSPIEHRVLVPPGVAGDLTNHASSGDLGPDDVVATVGSTSVGLFEHWPVRTPRPVRARLDDVEPLTTGQRALDLLFPIARGSTAAVPGGFGTGKTVLLQQLAKWSDADVIVYVGCGERGNEMADVVADLRSLEDPRSGGRLADRTVVVANTSDMPMMAREASIYTGVTVAEYYRDMGYDVVVIADSTSRWAEALREFASRTGALPVEEGYPADLASALAAFYERAAPVTTLGGRHGSVTVVGAVSPPGGDLAEPVTSHTQRFVRCLWTLDHDLAYARHYPAVSWAGSFSRDVDGLALWHARHGDTSWVRRRARVAALLAEADRLSDLAQLVGEGALPGRERMVLLSGRLVREAALQQSALSRVDAASSPAKTAALVDAVLAVADRCQQLVDSGVPAVTVEEVDFGPLLRAREESADPAVAQAQLAVILERLEGLLP
jgi:V/A-type H+-transporting ATPase subunit A